MTFKGGLGRRHHPHPTPAGNGCEPTRTPSMAGQHPVTAVALPWNQCLVRRLWSFLEEPTDSKFSTQYKTYCSEGCPAGPMGWTLVFFSSCGQMASPALFLPYGCRQSRGPWQCCPAVTTAGTGSGAEATRGTIGVCSALSSVCCGGKMGTIPRTAAHVHQ